MQTFVRAPGHPPAKPFDMAAAISTALERDGEAGFYDETQSHPTVPVFLLRRVGIAAHVLDVDERHIGTFACPVAAMRHGFGYMDRAACVSPPTRAPRGRPATRRRVPR